MPTTGSFPTRAWGKQVLSYKAIMTEIQEVYLGDRIPWVIGFSGGKDSTTVLQMVFHSLSQLPKRQRAKPIHVLCNDTLVENPAIQAYVDEQLRRIRRAGKKQLFGHKHELFTVAKVKPKLEDRFWVNLIGKGYPSPNRWFRWCTERLKINPTSDYVRRKMHEHGQVIIVLGTRKAESANRAASMSAHETGERLRPHTLPNAFVYPPIADLANNDVWAYLLQSPNPWNGSNRELLGVYGSACDGGECPFVIETGTQSCGKSRFGCWVCTVVDRDRSMENFVANGEAWMRPLLVLRNWLYDIRQQDSQYVPRQYRSRQIKFGPFLLKTRWQILIRLLEIQKRLPIQLISDGELRRTRELLDRDAEGRVENGLRKFVFQLRNGKRITTISDFNLLHSGRKRVGPFSLNGAKLIRSRPLSSRYSSSTRLMYYMV